VTVKYSSKSLVCTSGSNEGLSVETTARNERVQALNLQRSLS
jgi:hypothetical protein